MKRKPKLGQNFLVDDDACRRIADALGDLSERTVVEIGPGHGAITQLLASRAKRLICVELDRALAAELRFRFRERDTVEIIEADILTVDLTQLRPKDDKLQVVGNLPYYITSDILLHLCRHAASIELAVVMMQREVAERVAASPKTRDYGVLSVSVQMHAEVSDLLTLPPEAFSPPPEVYSTVLRLAMQARLEEFGITDEAALTRIVRAAFAQKRKTLGNNLRAAGLTTTQVQQLAEASGLRQDLRAEALSLQDFATLYKAAVSLGFSL